MRISAGLPTEAEQRAALAAAGVAADALADPWIDRGRKRGPAGFAQRSYMVGALREGDEVCVACLPVIGGGDDATLGFLADMTEMGAALLDASTGTAYRLPPGTEDGLRLVRAIKAAERALVLAKARAARRPTRATPQEWKEAKRHWLDATISEVEAAKRAGIPGRTMRRRFGPRGTPSFGRTPK